MIRYCVIPEEDGTIPGKGPKYLKWRFDPDPPGIDCGYVYISYGLIPAGLACVNVTQAQLDELSGYSDVAIAPADIDQNIGAGAVATVQNVLEALRIPADWVDTSYTYRQILRGVAGLFQLSQRHKGLHQEQLIDNQAQLDLQWNQIPPARRARLLETADTFTWDYSDVTNQWTIRQILWHLTQQWGVSKFVFYNKRAGISELL